MNIDIEEYIEAILCLIEEEGEDRYSGLTLELNGDESYIAYDAVAHIMATEQKSMKKDHTSIIDSLAIHNIEILSYVKKVAYDFVV